MTTLEVNKFFWFIETYRSTASTPEKRINSLIGKVCKRLNISQKDIIFTDDITEPNWIVCLTLYGGFKIRVWNIYEENNKTDFQYSVKNM